MRGVVLRNVRQGRRGGVSVRRMALLQLRGIVKTFGSRVILEGLDFDVEAGARVGVIGPTAAASRR